MSGRPLQNYSIRRSLVRRNDRPMSRAFQEFRTVLVDEIRDFGRSLPGVTILLR